MTVPLFESLPGPWVHEAVCAQVDGDLFFPRKGEASHEARFVCADCPVRVECLQYALDNNERYGIWGGHSTNAREAMRAGRLSQDTPVGALTCTECELTFLTADGRYLHSLTHKSRKRDTRRGAA